jgi:hypothetical protein
MQAGNWAERWEHRRLRHVAEVEAMERRKPLPGWITTVCAVALYAVVVAVAWSEAGPVLGLATLLVLAAQPVAKVFRWNWWEERRLPGRAEPIMVLRRSVLLPHCVFEAAVGLTLMVVSSGPAGVLLGASLGLMALLGLAVAVCGGPRSRRRSQRPSGLAMYRLSEPVLLDITEDARLS